MREQLRARDERMQMMLAGIAHEVRNPLGGIELYAGLLRDELAGDAEKLAHVQRIERELAHLKIIVNDFLEYARRPKPTVAACRRRRAARARCATSPSPPPSRATCACRCSSRAIRRAVAGDEGQLRRALLNLAHNAVQACAEDGTRRGHARLRARRRRGAA